MNILTANLDYSSNNLNTYDNITNNTFNRILNSSFHDEAKYKNIISEKGKENLKKINYSNSLNTNITCPIYQTQFTEEIEIINLPCNHSFMPEAIEKWLNEEKAECPVCRYKFDSKEIKKDDTQTNTNEFIQSLIRTYEYPNLNSNLNWRRNTRQRRRRNSILYSYETNEEAILETNEEAILETNEEPILETNEEPILETNEEPILETNEEPVLETNEEPMYQSLFNIINRSITEEDEYNLQEAILNSLNNDEE